MPAARYWRLVGITPTRLGPLNLSEVALFDGVTRRDGFATVSSSFDPLTGTASDLSDGSIAADVSWSELVVSLPSFSVNWDFGTAQNLTDVSLAAVSPTGFPRAFTLQHSADNLVWVTAMSAKAQWPGSSSFAEFDLPKDDFESLILAMGPLAYWPLSETSGTVAADIGPNGYHGEYQNVSGLSYAEGPPLRYGRQSSMGFSAKAATTAQVFVNNTALQQLADPGNSFTILMFHNRVADTTYNTLLSYFNSPGAGTSRYRIIGSMTGQSPDNTNSVSTAFSLNKTSFIAYRKDVAASKYSLRVDDTTSNASGFTDPVRSGSAGLMFPGAASWNYYPARGWLSDVVIFNRALSDAEMSQIAAYRYADILYGSPPGYSLEKSPVIQRISSYPVTGTTALKADTRPERNDMQDGGTITLTGTVKRVGDPDDVPLRRRVRLYNERDRRFIRETWSDAVTGAFAFAELKAGEVYTAFTYDHLNNYRALALDKITGV